MSRRSIVDPEPSHVIRHLAAGAGLLTVGRGLDALWQAPRRQVMVGGRRVQTVDAHAHTFIPAVADVVKGTDLERSAAGSIAGNLPMSAARLQAMDAQGIDVEVLTINPWWYGADRPLAEKIIEVQNQGLAKLVAASPDRFALATVALQHPELAAEQLAEAFKNLKMRGASMGAVVNSDELASPTFDPFWKKAEELGALLFIHPEKASAISWRSTARARS